MSDDTRALGHAGTRVFRYVETRETIHFHRVRSWQCVLLGGKINMTVIPPLGSGQGGLHLSHPCTVPSSFKHFTVFVCVMNRRSITCMSKVHKLSHILYRHTHASPIGCSQLDAVKSVTLEVGRVKKGEGRQRRNAISTPSAHALFTLHVVLQECHQLSEKWCVQMSACLSGWCRTGKKEKKRKNKKHFMSLSMSINIDLSF